MKFIEWIRNKIFETNEVDEADLTKDMTMKQYKKYMKNKK